MLNVKQLQLTVNFIIIAIRNSIYSCVVMYKATIYFILFYTLLSHLNISLVLLDCNFDHDNRNSHSYKSKLILIIFQRQNEPKIILISFHFRSPIREKIGTVHG